MTLMTGVVGRATEVPEKSPFAGLLPTGAVVVEATPSMWIDGLLPTEKCYVANAVPKRVREFTAGRNCARAALTLLGLDAVAIPVGPDRAPIFPAGVSASITHTDGYCAAAAVIRGGVDSLGIDAEAASPLDRSLISLVLTDGERERLNYTQSACFDVPKALFCIKEAFYKAYFQQTRRWLDFHDVTVELDIEGSVAMVALTQEGSLDEARARRVRARYTVADERVYCAVELPRLW